MRVPVRLGVQPLIVEDALLERGYRPLGLQDRQDSAGEGDIRTYRDPVRFAIMGGPIGFLGALQEDVEPAPLPEETVFVGQPVPPPTEAPVIFTPPIVSAPAPSPTSTGTTPSFFQVLPAIVTAGAIAARTIQQIVSPPKVAPSPRSPYFGPAYSGLSVPFGTVPGTVPPFPGRPPAAAGAWYTQPAVLVAGGLGALLLVLSFAKR